MPFPYLGTSLLACLLGLTLPWPINLIPFFRREKANQRAVEQSNDHLEILVSRACREIKAVFNNTEKPKGVYRIDHADA